MILTAWTVLACASRDCHSHFIPLLVDSRRGALGSRGGSMVMKFLEATGEHG